MYPVIYNYNSTDFSTQGLGALSDCISCEVTEELNGVFTLELQYPLLGARSEYLTTGNIIAVKPSSTQTRQAFRINQVKKSFASSYQVYANHISYDLSGFPIRQSATYNGLTSVINALNNMTWDAGEVPFHRFTFQTDLASSATFSMEGIQTVRSWMGGQDGSILATYGGEWSYDNFNCYLMSRRGRDTGYRISYGKNLAEYEKQRDYASYSHVCAYWKKSEDIAYSDLVATGVSCAFRCAYLDASSIFSNRPTTAQLNTYAASQAGGLNMLPQTITITPAQLGNKSIGMGDSVLICYENVLQTRVVKTVWNVLAGEYKTIELGTRKTSIADTIKSVSGGSGGSSYSPISITVDDTLSTVSTNPVQNKVITNALGNKVTVEAGKGLSTNDYTTADKDKLSGIESGAEVNQNAFGNVMVGGTTIAADSETDTLTIVAGDNITLTPDATNDTLTIAAVGSGSPSDYVIEQGTGYVKWASGKMECWKRETVTVNCTSAWSSGIYYGSISGRTYPQTFEGYPVSIVHAQVTNGGAWMVQNYDNYSASQTGQLYFYRVGSSAITATINIYAVGRWEQ